MDIETILLIIFVVIDVVFLGFSIYEHNKEYKFRERELAEMKHQSEIMEKKEKRRNEEDE